MGNLVDAFLTQISSVHTRRAYRTDLRRFFGSGDVLESDVRAVSADAVQACIRTMDREDLSVSTQRRCLAALSRFFDWLVKQDVVVYNPVRAPEVEPVSSASASDTRSSLTREEVERLTAAAGQNARTGLRDQALLLTIVYAALRRSEVATLEVDDVRPLGRHWIIDLEATGSAQGGYVRVPEVLVEVIERMRETYQITDGRLWRSLSNRNRGAPMSPDAIYKVVRRTSEAANLDGVTIDTLRRTGLRLALDGGADLRHVQAHGRFRAASTAASLRDQEEHSGRLTGDAIEYIDLDVSDVVVEET